jgi:D-arabinose 5-phosphate isomerase GutQ/beta-phosphoglucomutase-like phosphatase (HAD superfamily)
MSWIFNFFKNLTLSDCITENQGNNIVNSNNNSNNNYKNTYKNNYKNKILNYDLYVFDFDGTIIDSEYFHYYAWLNALQKYKHNDIENNINFTENDYYKYFHNIEKNSGKNFIKYKYDINNFDEIYKLKQEFYANFIKNENILLKEGIEDFLNLIIKYNKKFIIVTNTSNEFIELYKLKYGILNKAEQIYTKENFKNRKPNPECYIKISHMYKNERKIGFEDSLTGMHALYQVSDILPIFIDHEGYFYSDFIKNNYKNIGICNNYNINILNNEIANIEINNNLNKNNNRFIDNILLNNINELHNNFNNMKYIIKNVSLIVKSLDISNNVYLTGMGKSGYVCKKCASTWQSLSINCSYIDLPNLPHGDFGIFKENDLVIFISNSGNTEEIIYILKYIKDGLNKKITTISIVANENSIMEKYSDYTFILKNIKEADEINMTPSTSSLIFTALLDDIAINIKSNVTKNEFQRCHPGGSLGKSCD